MQANGAKDCFSVTSNNFKHTCIHIGASLQIVSSTKEDETTWQKKTPHSIPGKRGYGEKKLGREQGDQKRTVCRRLRLGIVLGFDWQEGGDKQTAKTVWHSSHRTRTAHTVGKESCELQRERERGQDTTTQSSLKKGIHQRVFALCRVVIEIERMFAHGCDGPCLDSTARVPSRQGEQVW